MAWNEADHPRDDQGRFASKAGGGFGVLVALVLFCGALGASGSGIDVSTSQEAVSWTRSGYTFTTQRSTSSTFCRAYAYGQVQEFLTDRGCTDVQRGLYSVTHAGGHNIIVSTAVVTMSTAGQAEQLQTLVDRHGSGNITELGTVEFSGYYYDSQRTGTIVAIAQAEPAAETSVPASILDEAASTGLSAPLTG